MTTLTQQDDVRILAVEGELNRATAGQFRDLVENAFAEDARDFIVDLVDCTGVDSVGLESLTWLHRTCEEKLGMAKLCAASDSLEQILQITRLTGQLDVRVTLDEALDALK